MIYARLITVVFLFCSSFALSQRVDLRKIDHYTENARKEWDCPGLAIGIIHNDSVVFAKGFGTISSDSEKPVDANTLFGIASNTKAFTAAAIATFVDDKKIEWDEKVVQLLPYFRLYNDYVTNEITLRDILSHRTGLRTFSGDLIWYGSEHKPREIIERARYLKPAYGFRAHYGYSNIMYLTAGEIVASLHGKSYENFIIEKFFKPLGMERSNVSIRHQKKDENVAQPHAKVDGKWIPIPYVNWDNIAPAGAINSTVNDMLKWIRLQLNRGQLDNKVYWSERQSREMWLPQTIDNVSSFSERLHPSKHFSAYGLGWDLFDFYGYKIVNHSGGLDGMISHVFMIPELNIGCVILSNSATSLPYALMHQYLEILIGDPNENDWSATYLGFAKGYEEYVEEKNKEKERIRKKGVSPTFDMKNYTGIYSGNVYGNAKVDIREGKLYLRLMHTPTMQGYLNHWEEDVFSIVLTDHPSLPKGEVTFVLDEDKTKVMRLVINIPNPDFDFTELDFNKVK